VSNAPSCAAPVISFTFIFIISSGPAVDFCAKDKVFNLLHAEKLTTSTCDPPNGAEALNVYEPVATSFIDVNVIAVSLNTVVTVAATPGPPELSSKFSTIDL